MMEYQSNSNILTPADVCRELNISRSTLQRLMEDRLISYYRIGRLVKFHKNDVEQYLQKVRVEAAN